VRNLSLIFFSSSKCLSFSRFGKVDRRYIWFWPRNWLKKKRKRKEKHLH